MSLEAGAAQRVLQEWFLPYWELAQSACLLDGGSSEHAEMAIELGKQSWRGVSTTGLKSVQQKRELEVVGIANHVVLWLYM